MTQTSPATAARSVVREPDSRIRLAVSSAVLLATSPTSGQVTSTPSTISAGSFSLPVPASSRWARVSVPLPVMTTVSKPPKWPVSSQPVSAQQSPDSSSHRIPPEVLQRLGT